MVKNSIIDKLLRIWNNDEIRNLKMLDIIINIK